jgi:hypothetical protein
MSTLNGYTRNAKSLSGLVNIQANRADISTLDISTAQFQDISIANGVTASTLTGTLQTPAQPNITSVGTLSSLNVTNGVTASTLTGTVQTPAQSNITSVGTLSSLNVSGNLGVGTTSPQYKLDVAGGFVRFNNVISTDEYIDWVSPVGISFYRIFNASNMRMVSGTTASGAIEFNTSGFRDGMIFYKHDDTTPANRHLAFYVNGPNERARINADGNLGIGITNPTSKLHVIGSSNITGNTTIGGTLLANVINQNSDSATASLRAVTATSIASTMITANGGVSAATFASWNNPEGVSLFRYQDACICRMVSAPLTSSTIEFNTTNGQDGSILYKHDDTTPTNRYLSFQVNSNVERLRIDSSGNLGIGITNPTSRLHVAGTAEITGALTVPSVSCSGSITGTLSTSSQPNISYVNSLDVGTGNNPTSSITYTMNNLSLNKSIKKFGTASIDFTGASSSLIIKGINSTNFPTLYSQFSTGYTIEFWVYPVSLSATRSFLFSAYDEGYFDFSFIQISGVNYASWRMGTTASGNLAVNSIVPGINLNAWNHISIRFDNSLATNKYRFSVNGVSPALGGNTANIVPLNKVFNSSQGVCLGARYNNGSIDQSFTGYIDEFRISVVNRYSNTNFTPPTTQFATDANTVLLNRLESMYLYNSQIAPTTTTNVGVDIDDGSVLANNGVYTRYGNLEARASDSVVKLGGSQVLSSSALNLGGSQVLSTSTLGATVTNASLNTITPAGGILGILGAIGFRDWGYINHNTNGGGGTRNVTFTTSGVYLVTIGRNYNDINIFTTIWVTVIVASGTGKTGGIYVPQGFSVNINGVANGFSISSSYPAGYNSFQVQYIHFF